MVELPITILVYWSVTTSIFVSGFYSEGSNTFWNPSWILDMKHITFLSLKTAELTEYGFYVVQIDSNSSPSVNLGIPSILSFHLFYKIRAIFPSWHGAMVKSQCPRRRDLRRTLWHGAFAAELHRRRPKGLQISSEELAKNCGFFRECPRYEDFDFDLFNGCGWDVVASVNFCNIYREKYR